MTMGICVALICVAATPAATQEIPDMKIWAVDPLVKVFLDAVPGDTGEALAEVARGEHASLQVCVRSDVALSGLRAKVSDLRHDGATLKPRLPRFVGYVNVDRPTQTPASDQLRKPPAEYPDPLLEEDAVDVAAGRVQPVWVTVQVPTDASAGIYRGVLTLLASAGGKPVTMECPIAVRVYDVTVEKTRLWVTDWFSMGWKHRTPCPEPDSDAFYAVLRRFARNMADHRHNVAIISPLGLAEFSADADGALAIDWSRFDRWVDIFTEEGVIGRIEGGHIGGRTSGWNSEFAVGTRKVDAGKVVSASVDPASSEADAFYGLFFPALVKHLREKGWLDNYVQHLADEPIEGNVGTYRAMAGLIRKYAPELKIFEACHTKDLVGSMDIWVPQINYLHEDYAHYQARQKAGDEVWFYTCVFPQGEYANRFIEQPLLKTRLLHWINFRYGATGYLHWGYNQWRNEDPFTEMTPPHGGPPYLPAGDAWIVYPGKDGPLDSIRFEAMRDGIVDHELLSMLAEGDPDAADAFAEAHVLNFDRYNTDVEAFRATRRALLEALSGPAK
ncbi:MAG: DUF4091 domain-containing protein [bacterium]|nr:DUF4091 domain-containing protein [bacterium]